MSTAVVASRDLLQHSGAGAAAVINCCGFSQRRVGDDRSAMCLAPRQDGMFDGAFAQVVEHLVAGGRTADGGDFLEIVDVKIADAP